MSRKIRLLHSWTVYSEKEKTPTEHPIALYPHRTLSLDKLYNAHTLTMLDNWSYVHSQWQNALVPAGKPNRIGLLFTLKNSDIGAISVTERGWAASISKVERHRSDRLLPHFGTVWTEIRNVSEVNNIEQVLESSETKVNIYEWEMGFSSPHSLTLTQLHDVRCVFKFCAVAVHTMPNGFSCQHEKLSVKVWK